MDGLLMETKQIISWLRDKAVRADNPSWTRMMNMAADRLDELDRAGEWTPMAEMPPKRNGTYFVCTVNEFYQTTKIAKANWRGGAWFGQGGAWSNVTHWMPLPNPPEVR